MSADDDPPPLRPLLGFGFWAALALCAACIAGGVAVVLFAPGLRP